MTNITTFVKHDDLILNVETRGPINGATPNRYVTKVWFGETEYSSPATIEFFHTGKDVNLLHVLAEKTSEMPLEYEKTVRVNTRGFSDGSRS